MKPNTLTTYGVLVTSHCWKVAPLPRVPPEQFAFLTPAQVDALPLRRRLRAV